MGRGLQRFAVTAGRESADQPPHPAPKVAYGISENHITGQPAPQLGRGTRGVTSTRSMTMTTCM